MILLPKKAYLAATGKHWQISYVRTPGELTLVEYPNRKLIIYGKRYAKHDAMKLLVKWVKIQAKEYLHATVTKLNRKIKADFKKIRIHALKMEWGSYSTNKIISLNFNLIFIPPSLVKHLIIHELCHTRHLNHSAAFWKEVAKYDKNWQKNKIKLEAANIYIPDWVVF